MLFKYHLLNFICNYSLSAVTNLVLTFFANSLFFSKLFSCSFLLVLLFLLKIFRLQCLHLHLDYPLVWWSQVFAANRTPLCASVKLRKNCCYWDLFWGGLVTSASGAGKWRQQQMREVLQELPSNKCDEKCSFLPVSYAPKWSLCKEISNWLIWVDGQRDI